MLSVGHHTKNLITNTLTSTNMVRDEDFVDSILGIDVTLPEEEIKKEMVEMVYQQLENGLNKPEIIDMLNVFTAEQLEAMLFKWFD